MQLSDAVRNARVDAIEATAGAGALMRIFSGSAPANCAAADSGTVLAELTLPSNWMNAPSGGSASKAGTWQDASANASGTAGHWRLYNSAGTVCHAQGTASAAGGGGDMILSTTTLTAGASFTVNTFTITDGNA
jgi:hypothetical protein